jgi:lipopolysaccharide biosynthesis protein
MTLNDKPRLISFYLPQFHPIPENNHWWGKGFTEWTNVARARPLVKGHYQPHLPAELGFYDLRLPETRQAQANLARQYGIFGFCYYHYWFNGKRLLQRPLDEVLKSGEPDFPFCVCWANENWTRRWNGEEQDVLMKQTYSAADDLAHIRALIPSFQDPRYIKINGRPLVLIYRVSSLPQPRQTADIWRQEAIRAGFPDLYLCTVVSLAALDFDPTSIGFDAAVDFPPNCNHRTQPIKPIRCRFRKLDRQARRFFRDPYCEHAILRYSDLATNIMNRPEPEYKLFPCVAPGFDNSARRKSGASIYVGSTPEVYRKWLDRSINQTQRRFENRDERLVFVNAWNEWAEGNHLEPDQKWGHRYLEETKSALENCEQFPASSNISVKAA